MVLRYYLDLRETDIALWLGIPLGTVKWRLHEARRRLRKVLDDQADMPRAVGKQGGRGD